MKTIPAVKIADNTFQVDLRGWMCPYPKYAIEPILEKMPKGSRLHFLVDCPAATGDVPRLARAHGHAVEGVRQVGSGEWEIDLLAKK